MGAWCVTEAPGFRPKAPPRPSHSAGRGQGPASGEGPALCHRWPPRSSALTSAPTSTLTPMPIAASGSGAVALGFCPRSVRPAVPTPSTGSGSWWIRSSLIGRLPRRRWRSIRSWRSGLGNTRRIVPGLNCPIEGAGGPGAPFLGGRGRRR